MFLNTGDTRFGTISGISGTDYLDDARCIAVTDWDNDGDQDFWISNRSAPRIRLMRNNAKWNHHYLSIGLVGNGKSTNRDAIGARVEIILDQNELSKARPLVKTLRAGEGFLSQSSKWLHFGLGKSASIAQVLVTWPDGERESFNGLHVDKRYQLTQGTGVADEVQRPDQPILLEPSQQIPLPPTRVARVALQTRLPMPSLSYRNVNNATQNETFPPGKATVVNLWASWCRPCVEELSELNRRSEELSQAGIEVLSLAADASDGTGSTQEDDVELMKTLDYAHAWGFIDEGEIDLLQQLHHQFFFLRKSFPLPMTFLVDADGRLSTIYRGPITVDQLLADANRNSGDYPSAFQQAACLPGRAIEHPRVVRLAKSSEFHTRYLFATLLEGLGRYQDAMEHFDILAQSNPEWQAPLRHLARLHLSQNDIQTALEIGQRALRLDPNDTRVHNTLALIYSRQKLDEKSEFHFREAIRLDPAFAEAHNNLGSMLASQGKLTEAAKHFAKAVKIDDRFAEAHTNLGSVYASQRNFRKALVHFRRATEIDPDYVDAYNNLGSIYASVGQFEKAIQYYQQALKIDKDHADSLRNLKRAKEFMARQKSEQRVEK